MRRASASITAAASAATRWWPTDARTIGDLTLVNVEATVREAGGPALLGNSFLNRMEMRRDGQTLTLTKRF